MQFDRMTLGREAKELGFVRDTFEKVCRLAAILSFFEQDEVLKELLALKGGTAINLTIFDLPRLSVDIDLDLAESLPRDAVSEKRSVITGGIEKYMTANGYSKWRPSTTLWRWAAGWDTNGKRRRYSRFSPSSRR